MAICMLTQQNCSARDDVWPPWCFIVQFIQFVVYSSWNSIICSVLYTTLHAVLFPRYFTMALRQIWILVCLLGGKRMHSSYVENVGKSVTYVQTSQSLTVWQWDSRFLVHPQGLTVTCPNLTVKPWIKFPFEFLKMYIRLCSYSLHYTCYKP